MPQLAREIRLAYLAGAFDGEGYIGIYRRSTKNTWQPSYTLRITVTQVTRGLPEMFKEQFGGSILIERRSKKGWKDCYDWVASANIAAAALSALLPYLTVKRRHAELALEFQVGKRRGHRWSPTPDSEVARRESLHVAIKALNHRGAPCHN